MARAITTIYIDDAAIRVLVARGRNVVKWATLPLGVGLVKDGLVVKQEEVAERIKELWQREKIESSRVVAGVSGINCLYRLLTLPELSRELLPEAVKREADRVLGVPIEQLYLSWQVLPSPRGEALVYLVASPKAPMDAMVATLRHAGLNPYLMDVRPLALARTVTEPRAIIVDLQRGNFDIVIMVDSMPQVARSLPVNREATLEEKATIIKQELERAIVFYNSSHADKPIEVSVPLFVSGELADQENVWKILTGRQERPVRVLSLPVQAPEAFPATEYVTNVGLALKEVLTSEKGAIAYSIINFNALPEVYVPKPRSLSEILFLPTIVTGIVLVAFAAYFNITASGYTETLQNKLTRLNQQIIAEHVRPQDIILLSGQVSSAEATASAFSTMFQSLSGTRTEMNGDLAEINRVIGKDIVRISHDGRAITIEGSAGEERTVLDYAKQLTASKRFSRVIITSMTREEGGIRFTLNLAK